VNCHGEMPWFSDSRTSNAEDDADMFIRTYPILAEHTLGEDAPYVKWFQKVLIECEHGHIIYTMDDYSFCMEKGYIFGAREPFIFPPMGESRKQGQSRVLSTMYCRD